MVLEYHIIRVCHPHPCNSESTIGRNNCSSKAVSRNGTMVTHRCASAFQRLDNYRRVDNGHETSTKIARGIWVERTKRFNIIAESAALKCNGVLQKNYTKETPAAPATPAAQENESPSASILVPVYCRSIAPDQCYPVGFMPILKCHSDNILLSFVSPSMSGMIVLNFKRWALPQ